MLVRKLVIDKQLQQRRHRRGKDSVLVKHSHDADPSVHTGRAGLNNICCFIRSTTEVILTTVINFVREFFSVIFAVFFVSY